MNESEQVDLEVVLKSMEDSGTLPQGFIISYFFIGDNLKEDGNSFDLFSQGITTKYGMEFKKTVLLMPEDKLLVRYDFIWMGEYAHIKKTLEDFETDSRGIIESLIKNQKIDPPMMNLGFLAEPADLESKSPDDELF